MSTSKTLLKWFESKKLDALWSDIQRNLTACIYNQITNVICQFLVSRVTADIFFRESNMSFLCSDKAKT